jgi:hypothetical protein
MTPVSIWAKADSANGRRARTVRSADRRRLMFSSRNEWRSFRKYTVRRLPTF